MTTELNALNKKRRSTKESRAFFWSVHYNQLFTKQRTRRNDACERAFIIWFSAQGPALRILWC